MSFLNERGQYGFHPRVGAEAPTSPTGSSSKIPLMLGVVGLAAVGLAVLGARVAAERPRLSPHEKEVRAWKREFPGLPWFQDEVRSTCQLDLWERARDHWERTH